METSNGTSSELLNVEQLFEARYIVPLYQRNFAWTDENITQLIEDIVESIRSEEQNYYIGNLVVVQRASGEYEVIDGQQRLTTLALLSCILQFHFSGCLKYDSRPEVENFLNSVMSGIYIGGNDSAVSHYDDAFKCISSVIGRFQSESNRRDFIDVFSDYVREHVCLVREVVPVDTDVAEYFEIMNNRGEQLQEHEIVKGLLLKELKDDAKLSSVCSYIWDACSQMNERIQKVFPKSARTALFGEEYDTFVPAESNYKEYFRRIDIGTTLTKGVPLDEILRPDFSFSVPSSFESNDEEMPEIIKEESIIDFPNFLMHVLRLYYNDLFGKEGVPLHDKYLLQSFRKILDKIDSAEFIYRLLRCRTVFDRYVVKSTIIDGDKDDGRIWSLMKPFKFQNKTEKTQLRFKPTFDEPNKQEMIIKALSCIQVGHSSRYYKNYLLNLFSWFRSQDSIVMNQDEFLNHINGYILFELQKLETAKFFGLKDWNQETQNLLGTKISNYVLNYLDYLIWNLHKRPVDFSDTCEEWSLISNLNDFRFQYWNSIEHHYPQKRQKEIISEDVNIFELNCLGNVFLVSKSTNSRLSDKNPADKAILYSTKSNMAPNRQLIYAITKKEGWSKIQIENHLKFIECIYGNAATILNR